VNCIVVYFVDEKVVLTVENPGKQDLALPAKLFARGEAK